MRKQTKSEKTHIESGGWVEESGEIKPEIFSDIFRNPTLSIKIVKIVNLGIPNI